MPDYLEKRKIGMIVRKLRHERNMTQEELALKVNCDQSVISRIELGNDYIDRELYVHALKYFNLTYEENDSVKSLLNRFIENFMTENEDYFSRFDDELSLFVTDNAFLLCHYPLFLAAYHYYRRNESQCEEILKNMEGIAQVMENGCYDLYLIILLGIKQDEEGEKIIAYLNEYGTVNQELITFQIALYYFKRNNRSQSLKYLLAVVPALMDRNYFKKHYLAEIMVISLLVKEHDFYQVHIRAEKLLEKYGKILSGKETATVHFLIGYTYYLAQNYDEAAVSFKRAADVAKDKNYLYFYLLKIYKKLDDLPHYREILSKLENPAEETFGDILINLYLQGQIAKSENYYHYIEAKIVPLIPNHYEKMEIGIYTIELLDYYYDHQQYSKYFELSQKLLMFFCIK